MIPLATRLRVTKLNMLRTVWNITGLYLVKKIKTFCRSAWQFFWTERRQKMNVLNQGTRKLVVSICIMCHQSQPGKSSCSVRRSCPSIHLTTASTVQSYQDEGISWLIPCLLSAPIGCLIQHHSWNHCQTLFVFLKLAQCIHWLEILVSFSGVTLALGAPCRQQFCTPR